MCHDTEVIFFIIHNCGFEQHNTASVHFILITKWFPRLFTHGASLKTVVAKLLCLTASGKLDIYIAAGRIKALMKAVCKNMLVDTSRWPPPGSQILLICTHCFELYSGPFVLTSRRYTPCFMFLMVTGFILLGWMSRLVWVSPSQMPIRHLWLLITCQPLGLRSSGSHTWLHPDYILPPARFIWLFMVRAVLLQSTKSNATDWKRVSRGVPNPKLDFTTLTIIFNVKSVHVSGL